MSGEDPIRAAAARHRRAVRVRTHRARECHRDQQPSLRVDAPPKKKSRDKKSDEKQKQRKERNEHVIMREKLRVAAARCVTALPAKVEELRAAHMMDN